MIIPLFWGSVFITVESGFTFKMWPFEWKLQGSNFCFVWSALTSFRQSQNFHVVTERLLRIVILSKNFSVRNNAERTTKRFVRKHVLLSELGTNITRSANICVFHWAITSLAVGETCLPALGSKVEESHRFEDKQAKSMKWSENQQHCTDYVCHFRQSSVDVQLFENLQNRQGTKCNEIQRFHHIRTSFFVWLECAVKSEGQQAEQEHGQLKCQQ